jgi:hypothetical protein
VAPYLASVFRISTCDCSLLTDVSFAYCNIYPFPILFFGSRLLCCSLGDSQRGLRCG